MNTERVKRIDELIDQIETARIIAATEEEVLKLEKRDYEANLFRHMKENLDSMVDMASLVKAYEKCWPLYKCDPDKYTECSKTGCQKQCNMTRKKEFSTDGIPLTLEKLENLLKGGKE